jgi:integrase
MSELYGDGRFIPLEQPPIKSPLCVLYPKRQTRLTDSEPTSSPRVNPIALVRVKGGSKTVGEFELIVATLQEPWRLMVQIAQCLGLRVSEIAALQWDDFDFEKNQLLVQRSFVNGRVDDVKTEYSQDYVPLHASLTEIVLKWSTHAVPTDEGRIFANPMTGRPFYPSEIQKRHLRPSGCCAVGCPTCGAEPGVCVVRIQRRGTELACLFTMRA